MTSTLTIYSQTFWVSGSCPYGKRCCFIHTELPGGAQPGQDGIPPLSSGDGRPRSDSDPNDSTSLLARISAKRQEPPSMKPNPTISTTPPSAGLGRPGSLRVDTSVLDPAGSKQNKSAFPTFTHNGILVPAKDEAPTMSPGPVTAGPDFGRHAAARLDIVGSQVCHLKPHDPLPDLTFHLARPSQELRVQCSSLLQWQRQSGGAQLQHPHCNQPVAVRDVSC